MVPTNKKEDLRSPVIRGETAAASGAKPAARVQSMSALPGFIPLSVLLQLNSTVLGCGSFVRGRKRKKGDSIPFILSRRDYM